MTAENIDWAEFLKGMAAGSKRTPLEDAAPDLLEALEAIDSLPVSTNTTIVKMHLLARTAIQKAKGGTA